MCAEDDEEEETEEDEEDGSDGMDRECPLGVDAGKPWSCCLSSSFSRVRRTTLSSRSTRCLRFLSRKARWALREGVAGRSRFGLRPRVMACSVGS